VPSHDPPDPTELRDEVLACAGRTVTVERARFELTREMSVNWPDDVRRQRRSGGLLRPVGRLAKTAGKAAATAAWRHWTDDLPGHLTGEGVVEPPARRYMLDFGAYAELYKDGQRWGGVAGQPVGTRDPSPSDRQLDLWWLLDAPRGTIEATLEGREALHGTTCRRLAVSVDLARASALAPGGMRVPSVQRFEELAALPLTVWIDGEHVRRVRFTEGDVAATTLTLDLVELDPGVGDLDWDRFPAFRTPGAAG
jgi:hypothetical protein